MDFIPVTIDNFVDLHVKSNPEENADELKKRLQARLLDFKENIKCACGSPIWVIGSAFAGRGCFSCITGESSPSGDYEITDAIVKKKSKDGRRHIDDMGPAKIAGIIDDEGYEIIPELVKKPPLCLICLHDDQPGEEFFCALIRHGHKNEEEFTCFSFEEKT